MTRTQLSLLLGLALLLAGGLFLILEGGPDHAERVGLSGPGQAAESSHPRTAPDVAQREPRGLTEEEQAEAEAVATTVVLPLKIELELVAAAGRLAAPGEKPQGSDATARLRGSVHTAEGTGVRGDAEFVAGPNKGRVLELDGTGRFGANDLYPGLSLVHLRGRGVPGALREVLLREDREAQLNVGFGRSATVYGEVRDRANRTLPGVRVVFDGQEVMTDEEGVFQLRHVASGKVTVFLSKPGFADLRSVEYISAGKTVALGELRYTLDEGASLRIALPDRVGTGAPAQVVLSSPLEPSFGGRERKYPWHSRNPITLYAGETVEVDGLPAARVRIQVFQPGAVVEPATRETTLVPGEVRTETFRMKPAQTLSGRVLQGGRPADRALVQLEMPDLTGASIVRRGGALGRAQPELDVLPLAPGTRQKVFTGADGRFELSAMEDLSAVRYLTATSADGRAWAGRVVRHGEYEVDLELGASGGETATLTLETSTRHQALPVEYSVDGVPHAALLKPGERLVIEDLPAGTWRYSARWGGEEIQRPTPLEVEGEADLFVPLPEGAVDGQPKHLRDSLRPSHARFGRRG